MAGRALAVPGGVLCRRTWPMAQCTALFTEPSAASTCARPAAARLAGGWPAGQQRLLIAIHHLVVDGVSWRVLLEDLQNVYRQLSEGQSVSLPAKTSALRDWAARLQAYAGSESLREELTGGRPNWPARPWHCRCASSGRQRIATRYRQRRLDAEHTRQLLQQAPAPTAPRSTTCC
jgi:hypothetical protein